MNRQDVEAVEEVLSESSRRQVLAEIGVGRGDYARVALERVGPTHPLESSFVQHPQQLALRRARQLGDLVEEEGSSSQPARSDLAARSVAPVKDPFSWPNSSLSTRVSVIAAQFTSTNGRAGARPIGVNE